MSDILESAHEYAVLHRETRFTGPLFSVVTDDVAMPDGHTAKRDFMRHVGAVGVVAIDDDGRVVLVRQYRHPVGEALWELPAGLIDVEGESLVHAAARELREEADLAAADWQLLVDVHTSPGCSNEVIRLYLARGLTPVPEGERHHREHEESEMSSQRVPLDTAVDMVLRGSITNAAACIGLLAAVRLRADGYPALRPIDPLLPPRRT